MEIDGSLEKQVQTPLNLVTMKDSDN